MFATAYASVISFPTLKARTTQRLADRHLQRHIDNLFVTAYASVLSCPTPQAQATLQLSDQMLYESWHDLSDVSQLAWQPTSGNTASTPMELAQAAALFTAFFRNNLMHDERTAPYHARAFLDIAPITELKEQASSALYLGVLQRGLHWIDLARVNAVDLRASHILQTVCRHRLPAMAGPMDLMQRLQNRRDVIIDEAALIVFHAGGARLHASTLYKMEAIRAGFAIALIDEWQDAALGLALLPSAPVAPTTAAFWYDGLVMQNTRDMALPQISKALFDSLPADGSVAWQQREDPYLTLLSGQAGRARHLLGQPEGIIDTERYKQLAGAMHDEPDAVPRYLQRSGTREYAGLWLTRAELHAVVENVMRELVLDPVHPGGTAIHAIATTLLRLGPAHGIDPAQDQEPALLVRAFNRLEETWHVQAHSIRPTLGAALYLVRSNDVVLFNATSPLTREQQIGQRMAASILPGIMLASGGSETDTADWKNIIMALATQAELNPQDAIPPQIGAATRALYGSLRAAVIAQRNAAEIITYGNPESLPQAMRNYMHQRLLAYAPLPVYNEKFLIGQLLRRELLMTDHDLLPKYKRSRTCNVMMNPAQCTFAMDPVHEFKQDSESFFSNVHFKGRSVDAKAALQFIRQHALHRLLEDTTLRAHLREATRIKGVGGNKLEIETDQHQQAAAHQMVGLAMPKDINDDETLMLLFGSATMGMVVKTLASGDPRQIAGLLPFIVPLYDIEEGLRLGDRQRITDGVLHFGRDALLWAIGAGIESLLVKQIARDAGTMQLARMRMAPAERAAVDTALEMHELTSEVPLDSFGAQAAAASEDPYRVHCAGTGQDADIPGSPEAPLSPGVWSAWTAGRAPGMVEMVEMVEMEEMEELSEASDSSEILDSSENSETSEASGSSETSEAQDPWDMPAATSYRASAIVKTPLRDRLLRITGLPGGAAGITSETLAARPTVMDFLAYWQRIVAVKSIRRPRGNGKSIINALFEKSPGRAYLKFEKFWLELYARSETAVILLNTAFERLVSPCHNCEISFGAAKAQVTGNRMALPAKNTISTVRYFSPDGPMPFQQARAWIHETVHWMTGLGDVPASLAADHRGATVYLTDRIISERGAYPPVSPRTVYANPEAVEGVNARALNPVDRVTKRRVANDWHIAENRYLDSIVDEGRLALPGQRVLGRDIARRVTVRQAIQLREFLVSSAPYGLGSSEQIAERVIDAFRFAPDTGSLKTLLSKLARGSDLFRQLAARWLNKPRLDRISVAMRDYEPVDRFRVESNRLSGGVSAYGNALWINRQSYFYFSELDLTRLSTLRRLTGTILKLFLNDLIPGTMLLTPSDPFAERGLAVLLENEILKQLRDGSPPRICAGLTTRPNAFLGHQTTIVRAAASEDIHLQALMSQG